MRHIRASHYSPPTSPVTRRGIPLLTVLGALVALLFATAIPSSAADDSESDSTGTGTGTSQAATLAAHLRKNPVYVTDQLPRKLPRSTAPDFAKLAKRTGVPTYVLVLPDQVTSDGGRLLGAVHDRLGRDGLYVLADGDGVADAAAFGVRAPADDAMTVTIYELPYDADTLTVFERFADVIAQGSTKAAARAEEAREKHGGDNGDEPESQYIGATDRDNQSFVTGIALVGVPLLILLLSPYVRRWVRRNRGMGPASTSGTTAGTASGSASGTASGTASNNRRMTTGSKAIAWSRSRAGRVEVSAALLSVVAVAVTALLLFDQKPPATDASPTPTAADLSARIDRVADGLKRDPVYSDPESPRVLDADQLAQLHTRIAKLKQRLPLHVALVPQLTEDESAGDADAFTQAVRDKLDNLGKGSEDGKDSKPGKASEDGKASKDGVYIVADPLSGTIDTVSYEAHVDANLVAFDVPDKIRYGTDKDDEAVDHRIGERLDDLVTFLGKAPRIDAPETSSLGSSGPDPTDSQKEDVHGVFFAGDFWPGLMIGALAAVLVFMVAAAVLGIVRLSVPSLRRRSRMTSALGTPTGTGGNGGPSFEAPADPSPKYLRRTARDELDTLAREFATADSPSPSPSPSSPTTPLRDRIRTRVWDCLDAATLLADRAGGGPDGRVDDDAAPADLAAAIVLARSARALLATGTDKPSCALNPLHGPAVSWRDAKFTPEDRRRSHIPVCARCRPAVEEWPDLAHTLRLTLPGPGPRSRSSRTPYVDAPGPISAARAGIPQLIRQAREYAGVQ
ncbi:hypothetical protein ACQB60_26295 [Actinomycetota bacterium Odt1-20B]